MLPTCKVSLIGAGFIGKVHLYAYLTLPFYSFPLPCKAQITHIVAAHKESALSATGLLPYSVQAHTDWNAAINDPEVDIVHICTPNIAHKDALLAAIAAGKHIYCEKPLVSDDLQAREVENALTHYQGVSQMTFHHRFFASVIKAKELIDQGRLGRIIEFRGSYLQSSHADPHLPARWKNFKKYGGGVLPDIGSHLLDLTDWLVGDLSCVASQASIPFPQRLQDGKPIDIDAEDSISMLCRSKSGAMGSLQISKLTNGHENDLELEIYGTRGALKIDCMRPHYLDFCDVEQSPSGWTTIAVGHRYASPDTEFPASKSAVGWTRAHCACLAAFLRKVAANEPDETLGLQRGLYVQKLMSNVENRFVR